MNCSLINPAEILKIEPGDLHEIVRGQERDFVDRLKPIVERQSTTLDLTHVERIDAAGIAALICLYGCAEQAGHRFSVTNATHHVAEILAIVGLDRILVSRNADPCPQSAPCLSRSAA
jgi:anti-anti-sigma factor